MTSANQTLGRYKLTPLVVQRFTRLTDQIPTDRTNSLRGYVPTELWDIVDLDAFSLLICGVYVFGWLLANAICRTYGTGCFFSLLICGAYVFGRLFPNAICRTYDLDAFFPPDLWGMCLWMTFPKCDMPDIWIWMLIFPPDLSAICLWVFFAQWVISATDELTHVLSDVWTSVLLFSLGGGSTKSPMCGK